MVEVVIIEDNLLFADALRAWAETVPGISVSATTATVEELLATTWPRRPDVVLMDRMLRAEPDTAANVRRLVASGHRVVVINSPPNPSTTVSLLAAGARVCLTRDDDALTLAEAVRYVAGSDPPWSRAPISRRPTRPSVLLPVFVTLKGNCADGELRGQARAANCANGYSCE